MAKEKEASSESSEDEQTPEERSEGQKEPVLPTSTLVRFVQEDGASVAAVVLAAASDGGLHLIAPDAEGKRAERAGIYHDADKSVGTWHEV